MSEMSGKSKSKSGNGKGGFRAWIGKYLFTPAVRDAVTAGVILMFLGGWLFLYGGISENRVAIATNRALIEANRALIERNSEDIRALRVEMREGFDRIQEQFDRVHARLDDIIRGQAQRGGKTNPPKERVARNN